LCRPGRTIALIGQTGSGKTTLTSLVPRFYDVTGGRVLLDGATCATCKLKSLAATQVGVIPQDPFPVLRHRAREHHLRRALSSATTRWSGSRGSRRRTSSSSGSRTGYDTVIGERGITLSGGQRQRLAIARALAVDPRHPDPRRRDGRRSTRRPRRRSARALREAMRNGRH
jgi:ATP-binding cassette subfamily B protein